MKFDLEKVEQKQQELEALKVQLKSEFFGLDLIIDKVVDSIYAWYVFPELITRPVIVNLWGMTGVGKTQLVRRISHILNFADRFVEVQMDGTSNGSYFTSSSISSILSSSSIEEGKPGILLLDEIQRFRTIDQAGGDIKVERYQDIWMLLSDGKFSADYSIFREVEDIITYQLWSKDNKKGDSDDDEDDDAVTSPDSPIGSSSQGKKFKVYPYEAAKLKRLLKLEESIQEIMTWDTDEIQKRLLNMKSQRNNWELDYTKLLIFISGNLDEAFAGATDTEDCDTDADIYHALTKKVTSVEIKEALGYRFKPEQISRFGNNNIIYPSLSRDSYEKLIVSSCNKYTKNMEEISDIKFEIVPKVYQEIYENSVYPTQGTRPVFSSVHKIFSTALTSIAIWAVKNGYDKVSIDIDGSKNVLIGKHGDDYLEIEVDLEIRKKRVKNSIDFNTLVAVHESGHALVYSVLTKNAPKEFKINLASFKGGYIRHQEREITSKMQLRDMVKIGLAGTVAEELIFGSEMKTTGAMTDIVNVTSLVNNYIRVYGFDSYVGYITGDNSNATSWNTDLVGTNHKIEDMLKQLKQETVDIIMAHQDVFKILVKAVLSNNTIKPAEFKELVSGYIDINLRTDEILNYSSLWSNFLNGGKLKRIEE